MLLKPPRIKRRGFLLQQAHILNINIFSDYKCFPQASIDIPATDLVYPLKLEFLCKLKMQVYYLILS